MNYMDKDTTKGGIRVKNPNLNKKGSIYGAWETEFGDWMIVAGCVHCYLLIGSTSALLIDTAYGEGNLRYLVESITHLPVTVVNTHGHLDHSGGNGFWSNVFMGHGGDIPAKEGKHKKLPFPNYEIRFLEDGQIFNLGNRQVEAISIGAHHKSSYAFLDKKNRSLYTGDEIESSQVLLFLSGETVTTNELVKRHLANMQKLKVRKGEFDRLIPAHNGAPISVDYIDDFIALSEQILNGQAKPAETVAGYGLPTFLWGGDRKLERLRLGRASFIVKKEK